MGSTTDPTTDEPTPTTSPLFHDRYNNAVKPDYENATDLTWVRYETPSGTTLWECASTSIGAGTFYDVRTSERFEVHDVKDGHVRVRRA